VWMPAVMMHGCGGVLFMMMTKPATHEKNKNKK
jgi:hypothetical protein